jgi:hypothetical protein
MRMSVWMRALLIAAVIPCVELGSGIAHAQPQGKAASAGVAAPSEESAKKATAYYMKGSDLLKAKKFALALEQFKLSYAAVPSPNSHLYIARCLVAMGDARAAYAEFDKVVDEAAERGKTEDKYLPTRDAAKAERDELRSKVALVTITVANPAPATTVRVGDAEVPREQWDKPFAVPPGAVEAKVFTDGKPGSSQSATIAVGQSQTLALDGAAAPALATTEGSDTTTTKPRSSALRPAAFVAGGVGVAGFIMFAVAGSMSQSTYDSLEKECGSGPCPTSRADDISSGKTQQTLANVGLVIGAVGVAAGATLFVLSLKKSKSAPAATTGLVIGPGYTGLNGTF